MDNAAVARVFVEIADMLEITGGDGFKIRAYRTGARAIEYAPDDIETLAKDTKLRDIPGIGKAIADKVTELLTTGHIAYYDRLTAELPPGVMTLVQIPGVGPKLAMRFASELQVTSVDELEAALRDGRVGEMSRVGQKTADNVLQSIERLRTKDRRISIGDAQPQADAIVATLAATGLLRNVSVAGSLRRGRETVGDVDIIGTADDPAAVMTAFVGLPGILKVLGHGDTKSSLILASGLQIDLRLVPHEAWGSLLQHFTGSKEHNVALREAAVKRGLSLSEYGITELETHQQHKFATEEAFYDFLGLQWMPPELRENHGEIDVAARHEIPALVELAAVQSDLHTHSDASDGAASVLDMALAAAEAGLGIVTIADLYGGPVGLSAAAIDGQAAAVVSATGTVEAARSGALRILLGAEVDLRTDGTPALDDESLARFDVVLGAITTQLGLDQSAQTGRLIAAMEHPEIDILAHPTCRKLLLREPIAVDLGAVFEAAARTGTMLEIDGAPDRLDLSDSLVRRAIDAGVMLVIGSDARSTRDIGRNLGFAVRVARRGWAGPQHIFNTLPIADQLALLQLPKAERAVAWRRIVS